MKMAELCVSVAFSFDFAGTTWVFAYSGVQHNFVLKAGEDMRSQERVNDLLTI